MSAGRAANSRKNRVGGVVHPGENDRMNDYQRIALVIRYLDERHTHQPDLESLALPPPSPANSRERGNIPEALHAAKFTVREFLPGRRVIWGSGW